jgi:DNA-binding NarL/FixJ family response regulator
MPPAKLLDAIREVTDGGSPMSAPIARKVVHLLKKIPTKGETGVELSPRERELLDGLAAGLAYKQIGEQMGVSIDTVRTYIRRIYEKLHVHSRTEAVVKYFGHP